VFRHGASTAKPTFAASAVSTYDRSRALCNICFVRNSNASKKIQGVFCQNQTVSKLHHALLEELTCRQFTTVRACEQSTVMDLPTITSKGDCRDLRLLSDAEVAQLLWGVVPDQVDPSGMCLASLYRICGTVPQCFSLTVMFQ